MNWVIDIVAVVFLLFFLLAGWRKGLLLSALNIARVILALGVSFFAGRYLGFWIGTLAHRPRIVTIPVVAGLTFVIIIFVFHVIMVNISAEHQHREEKEDFILPWYSCLGGSIVNLVAGLFSLVFLFWLGTVLIVCIGGKDAIPGAAKSHFSHFARRTVYESANIAISRKGKESQAAAMARVVSDPAKGMKHLKSVMEAESIQALFNDKDFGKAMLSGDPDQIEQNASLQQLFNDRETLDELKNLGLLSGREKKSIMCETLSSFGKNETIQTSMENLKAKNLLSTDKVLILIRDPDFDVIVGELLK